MQLLKLSINKILICYNNRRVLAISMHYGEEDANEFCVGLLQNLMLKLTEK